MGPGIADESLFERAQKDSCTTGKSTIGDEKSWNVFMRLDRDEAKWVQQLGAEVWKEADNAEKLRARATRFRSWAGCGR